MANEPAHMWREMQRDVYETFREEIEAQPYDPAGDPPEDQWTEAEQQAELAKIKAERDEEFERMRTEWDAISIDWAKEHNDTNGEHYGLNGSGTSAFTLCPICRPAH